MKQPSAPPGIASTENGLVATLRWSQGVGREKDISDARNLIAIKGDAFDWPYVESWCDRHGTRELLEGPVLNAFERLSTESG